MFKQDNIKMEPVHCIITTTIYDDQGSTLSRRTWQGYVEAKYKETENVFEAALRLALYEQVKTYGPFPPSKLEGILNRNIYAPFDVMTPMSEGAFTVEFFSSKEE